MLTRQKDLLGRFVGVQEFLDCHDGVLGTINQSGTRKALDDVVLQLDRRAVDQDAEFVTGRGEVSRERAHREALKDQPHSSDHDDRAPGFTTFGIWRRSRFPVCAPAAVPSWRRRQWPTRVGDPLRVLADDGLVLARTRGSHQQFKHPVKPGFVTVAGAGNDDLAPRT